MPEIAPWENPNLPAPSSIIERTIEGRTRSFALCHWDERLVWRDLDYSQLWWATLDHAATPEDWARALEVERFGRAFTKTCNKAIAGKLLGLEASCLLRLQRNFYVIADKNGGGMGRETEADVWRQFDAPDDKYNRHRNARAPSLWHPNRHFYGVSRVLIRALLPSLLERISPGFLSLIQAGKQAPAMQLLRDLCAWNFDQGNLFATFQRQHPALFQKVVSHFDLPSECVFHLFGERKQPQGMQLLLSAASGYQRWEVKTRVVAISTAHERLELQLRLRDALRAILISTEIEEILSAPARP